MTTGTLSRGGGDGSPYHYRWSKTWNGGDGKYSMSSDGSKHLQWNAYTMSSDEGVQTWKGTGYQYIPYNGTLTGLPVPVWDANDDLQLANKLAGAIRGHEFNLGVTVGEGRETISMVKTTALRIGRAALALKKGRLDLTCNQLGLNYKSALTKVGGKLKWSKTRKEILDTRREISSKAVSSTWLELQYGWKPLLSSVYDGMDAFATIRNRPRTDKIKVSRSKRTMKHTEYWESYWNPDRMLFETDSKAAKVQQITCFITENISTARSLGLLNPASVAWELVPFSFVADWFIPIGTYLDNLSVFPHVVATYWRTTTYEQWGEGLGYYLDRYGNNYKGSHTRYRKINISRTSWYYDPFVLPKFKELPVAMSSGHLKNAFALLHQIFT